MNIRGFFAPWLRGQPDDPQFGAERLATGTIRSFFDLPPGVHVEVVVLPKENASRQRIWIYSRQDVVANMATRITGAGEAMRRKA